MGSDFSFMIIRETSLSDLDQIVSFLRPQYENTYGHCDGLNEEVFRSDNVMNAKSKKLHVQKVADNVIDFYKRHGYCIVGERILTWTDFLDHEANIELWTMEN